MPVDRHVRAVETYQIVAACAADQSAFDGADHVYQLASDDVERLTRRPVKEHGI